MMQDFLSRLLGRSAKGTGNLAKERLQFVLIHDRINLPPERMEEMKREILAVIAKYVTIDDHNVDIGLQSRDRLNLLVAEVPFVKPVESPAPAVDENDDLPPDSAPDSSKTT
ncbi:MAG: cell division topological specificity factor MinE [Anaerolineae bacterium]|nr:cell division topological specificity factor MinE [Anaerolineae bacterium]